MFAVNLFAFDVLRACKVSIFQEKYSHNVMNVHLNSLLLVHLHLQQDNYYVVNAFKMLKLHAIILYDLSFTFKYLYDFFMIANEEVP